MESKVQEQLEIVVNEIISQQRNSKGSPEIELYKGDIIQKREDGIYLIRKIDFSNNMNMYENTFESIKKQNLFIEK
jgi:hypothetical protein